MFIVHLTYLISFDEVLKVRPKHVQFLEQFYSENKFLFSGRRYDAAGSVIVVNSNSEDEVCEIMSQDPFVKEGVAKYEIVGFDVTMKSKNINL
jgi:uncharacterized protein YciI